MNALLIQAARHGALPMLLASALALSACGNKNGGQQAPPPAEVNVIKAVTEQITLLEEYVGQTEAVDTVEIRARVSGILEKQGFQDGSRVKRGDLLFVIDPQPFIAALAQTKATLAQAQAAHVNSKQSLERIRPLVADKAISQQDLDTAIAREATDAANVESARAQVRTAQLNLDYTSITAPRDAVISKALIKAGGLVNASTSLLTTLYSVDPIYVNFAVSEQKLLEMQRTLKRNPGEEKGRLPTFRLKLADGTEYSASGTLNFVDAAVDPKSGTVQIRVQVPNHDRLLRAGQLVRVIFPSLKPLDAIRIPQQAVQELQGKRSVFVVDAENKAQYREVNATQRVGNDWVVEGGLTAGEMVIVEGVQKARPGAPVKPVVLARDANGNIVKPGEPAGDAKKGEPAKDVKDMKGGDAKSSDAKSAPAPDKGAK
ncbi:MAG: efflux transporter periplasmic adaptor subunit [Betaproteobacteria bacterium]|nr:efflux transporter periplasmic adaptor subunit [Betaproteobacteria bacterium]